MKNTKGLKVLSYIVLVIGIIYSLLTVSTRILSVTWNELFLTIVLLILSVAVFYTMQALASFIDKK